MGSGRGEVGPRPPEPLAPPTGTPFPKNFLQVVRKILSRLFRVFVHVYIHHFDRIAQMGSEAHVNTCYKHFYYFVKEFGLIDTKELEPLVSGPGLVGGGTLGSRAGPQGPDPRLGGGPPAAPLPEVSGGERRGVLWAWAQICDAVTLEWSGPPVRVPGRHTGPPPPPPGLLLVLAALCPPLAGMAGMRLPCPWGPWGGDPANTSGPVAGPGHPSLPHPCPHCLAGDQAMISFFLFFFFLMFIRFEFEAELEWGRSRERGRHRIQNRLQAPSHQHRALRGSNPQTVRS